MIDAIPEVRSELSPYAPKIRTMKINPDKIKDVIGKGGDMITKIILESSNVTSVNHKDAVKIDIDDDGNVVCYHMDKNVLDKAISMIEDIVKEVEIGEVYTGKVVKIEDFGAFVELDPGVDALLHVSQISSEHVEKPSDVLSVGQEIEAKIVDFNEEEKKISLSIKALQAQPQQEEEDADVADVDIDAVASELDAE